ncbi:MAG: amidase [Mesorhizobium sp.]|uniref:amidase n=1 Tax=Mesorhizobium sp. TaxID=1871066 RepID=UPI000FE3B816|nr:amidase [Mesorhizobium sp.]RWG80894.1 MAG: amidase [Mesorhizobium sp.]RWI44260.1 MAG: amidase [Mesorhizobium sp.]RWJ25237.1 MAG: amidase [Mesorhizobium sp.]RWJ89651.1 MAG: amidase [Mesorhizobium sp.]RWK15031.1 MAG: amidase [Mesorhizobium sp.]
MSIAKNGATKIASLDAVGQAEAVHRGDISPLDLVEAAIGRIEQCEGMVGALVHKRFDAARAEASNVSSNRPFPGVPILLKDSSSAAQVGIPRFAGNRVLKENPVVATVDTAVGKCLRDAGFVTLGVSKAPEAGWYTDTQPAAFGPTRNPWALDRSVGGSSGGAAAAVASGMVPVAHGSENGGSIRIPASFCGVVGFKPTRGLVPIPEPNLSHAMHNFVLCRTIRDAAALLDLLAVGNPRALYWSPSTRGYARAVAEASELPRLRVGVARRMGGVEAHRDCQNAVDATIPLLEDLGCEVIDAVVPPLDQEDAIAAYALLLKVSGERAFLGLEEMVGRPLSADDVEPFIWHMGHQKGAAVTALEYLDAIGRRRAWAVEVMNCWNDFDLLLSPTVCEPPLTLQSHAEETPEETLVTVTRQMAFAGPFNETGQPAISLPLHWRDDGLPIGVQLVTDMGKDGLLLAMAARLEALKPWKDKWPTICTD